MKNKRFFMGSILTPLIVGVIIVSVSVISCLGNPEFSTRLFFSLLSFFVIFSLINFAKADEKGITFFTFTFIPTRYNFSELIAKITLDAKPEVRSTGATILLLKNGKRKLLKLGLYPKKTQEYLLALLDSNIKTDLSFFHDESRWDYWFASKRKVVILERFLIGALLILIGLGFQVKTFAWNWKAKHWHQSTAVIECNEHAKDGSYKFIYKYKFDGKIYTGSQILGGAEKASSKYVPGTALPCVINQKNPSIAAVLTNYRADWLLCGSGIILMIAGLPFLIIAMILYLKKIVIPNELKKYPLQFSKETLKDLTFRICGECKISVGKISGGFRDIENCYGCFPPHRSIWSIIVQIFFFIISIFLGTNVMPHFLLVAIMILVLLWKTIFPRGVVFDWQEKKIYWFRFFSCKSIPAKMKYNDVLKAEDLTALGLSIRNDGVLMLSGVRKDGVYIPIAKASDKQMEQLFSDTMKIAKQLGDLPIITI